MPSSTVFLGALLASVPVAAVPNWHGCVDAASKGLPYCDTTLSKEKRLDDLISRFDLTDKIAQITPQGQLGNTCETFTLGKASIGLPPWNWLIETNTNIASGCPVQDRCATTFIGPEGLGASFNKSSWRLKGSVLGTEMRAFNNIGGSRFQPDGKNLIGLTGYGPNINIARDPRFGRTSELPGEDPVLSGTYAAEMVSGMQEKDSKGYPKMAAFLKHFTAYSREQDRGHDSYNISTFDFFDTYLPQYERAFKAQPVGVMCSYNAENGIPSCANNWLLNEQLRKWKPDAMVSTDCGAVENLKGFPIYAPDDAHASAYALMNGTDLEMGESDFNSLSDAVKQGLATEERINEAVRRSFNIHFDLGRFDPPEASEWNKFGLEDINSTLHQQINYEAALQGLVLLHNDNLLPLKRGVKLAVLGPQALATEGLLSSYAADQLCFGGNNDCIITIADGLQSANVGGQVAVAAGVGVVDNSTAGIAAAIDAAKAADVVVLALGADRMSVEHEGLDRTDTALPGIQEAFALQVLALGKPTILILTNGGAMAIDNLMPQVLTRSAPYAIVEAFNPATVGGRAIGASLFGLENRWGKLPVTMYPHSYIQEQFMTNYHMSKAPGRTYRYYQGTPLFPFGFGLSLTTFRLNGCIKGPERHEGAFTCTLTNTGNLAGDEVVQVYHRAVDIGKVDHPLPLRALVDFERVSVAAGGQVEVKFELGPESLQLINGKGERTLYPGKHELIFSRGSTDDEQTIAVEVPATAVFV